MMKEFLEFVVTLVISLILWAAFLTLYCIIH